MNLSRFVSRFGHGLLLMTLLVACGGGGSKDQDVAAGPADTMDTIEVADTSPGDVAEEVTPPAPPVYVDAPFLQPRARAWTSAHGLPEGAVTAIAADALGRVWAAGAWGLARSMGEVWEGAPLAAGEQPAVLDLLAAADKTLWVLTAGNLIAVGADGLARPLELMLGEGVALGRAGPSGAWVLTSEGVCRATLAPGADTPACDDWVQLPPGAPVDLSGAPDEGVFVATAAGLHRFSGDAWVETPLGVSPLTIRGLDTAPDGTLWVATDAGLFRLLLGRASAVARFTGDDGLPFEDLRRVDLGANGEVLLSTDLGAVRYHQGRFDVYHSRHWLPDVEVSAAAATADGALWFATSGGVGEVYTEETTLAQKAQHYEDGTYERHRRHGYISSISLGAPGDLSQPVPRDDDNDGQWTGMWLAALAYEHGATGDPVAKERAEDASRALRFLEEVTPRPGFIARSILPIEDCEVRLTGDPEVVGEWHASEDGVWCWKGNTSSDEFVGHLYGQAVYYDLVAEGDEKAAVAANMAAMVDDIVTGGGTEHTYRMVDVDGLPTDDGHFEPLYMSTIGIYGDAGKNGAIILGALLTAHHMTGEPRFMEHFHVLIDEHGYDEYVRNEKEIQDAFWINHDSDEMAFMAFHALMRYEDDPARRATWLEGLEGLWQTQRPERNPEFNMTWALLTEAEEIDLDASIETLKLIPWELVGWRVDNSPRADYELDPEPDRFGDPQALAVFPYDERHIMRWSINPYALAGGDGGHSEEAGTYWLLPYWMGRYGGLIVPE